MIPINFKNSDILKTLSMIQSAGFFSAIIAGGVIRDMYHNIPHSDIDIYLWDPFHSPENSLEINDPTLGYRYIWDMMNLNRNDGPIHTVFKEYSSNSHVTGIYDVHKDGEKYQLITVDMKPTSYVNEHFDIGLCKAYTNAEIVRYTPDFLTDATSETLTVVGKEMSQDQFDHTMYHHLPKLKEKYPNFEIKIADHNKHLTGIDVVL